MSQSAAMRPKKLELRLIFIKSQRVVTALLLEGK